MVHFDRLKLCPPNTRLDQGTKGKLPRDNHDETVRPTQRQSLGSNLQLLDDGDDVIPPLPPEVDGPAPVPAARPADIVPRFHLHLPRYQDQKHQGGIQPENENRQTSLDRTLLIEKREQCKMTCAPAHCTHTCNFYIR